MFYLWCRTRVIHWTTAWSQTGGDVNELTDDRSVVKSLREERWCSMTVIWIKMNLLLLSHLQQIFTSCMPLARCEFSHYQTCMLTSLVTSFIYIVQERFNTKICFKRERERGTKRLYVPPHWFKLKDRCGVNLACLINPSRRCRLKFRHHAV